MALKYYFSYFDIEGNTHLVNISSDSFAGDATEINGSIVYDFADVDNILECFRGSGLAISLEASNSLTLSDLYSEQERTYRVQYLRNGYVLFEGYLKPDGLYQDFVNEQWIIDLDAVDGLGFLENLSYVDSSGVQFTGKQSELDIVVNCLSRIGLELNINTAINIFYTGLASSVDPLANVYLNVDRFVKEDDDTIMDCEEVLRSVLEKYGACICQQNGEWYIFKPNEIFNDDTPTFFRYDYTGAALTPATVSEDWAEVLGSKINNRYPHHCNANQRIEIRGSLAAQRINYKYGLAYSLIENPRLEHNGSVITDWTILDGTNLTLQPDGDGIEIDVASSSSLPTPDVIESSILSIVEGDILNFNTTLQHFGDAIYQYFRVTLDDGVDTYTLASYGGWLNTATTTVIFESKKANPNYGLAGEPVYIAGDGKFNHTITSQPAPISGDVSIEVLEPLWDFGDDAFDNPVTSGSGSVVIDEVSITPAESNLNVIQGEFHTVERTGSPSSIIGETIDIYNGDNDTDLYIGAIYKNDADTPTTTWFREGVAEAKPILQIMGEEILRMHASPAQLFSGDIYGFIPYLRIITIDSLSGLFMVQGYSYNTKENIISLSLRQVFGDELADIEYTLTYDYGKTVKPTIKG